MKSATVKLIPTTTITIEIPVRLKMYLERVVAAAHWIIAAEIRRRIFEEKSLPRMW